MGNLLRNRRVRFVLAAGVLLATQAALYAKVTTIEIKSKKPAFNGQAFGAAGPYEEIKGIAVGEIDPNDPRNALITDIKFAPKNANGRVTYRTTFTILKPVDMSKASGTFCQKIHRQE